VSLIAVCLVRVMEFSGIVREIGAPLYRHVAAVHTHANARGGGALLTMAVTVLVERALMVRGRGSHPVMRFVRDHSTHFVRPLLPLSSNDPSQATDRRSKSDGV
jgi:hypothetical protein